MVHTRTVKIMRDVFARKGRSVLVVLSIMIGVFGATTMTSVSDLLSSHLEEDLSADAISHLHIYVRTTGDALTLAQNQAILDRLKELVGVVDAEGQGVYAVGWRQAGARVDAFEDGYLVTFTEPFGAGDLEPVARITQGRYPESASGEIAVEQRFADEYAISLGDTLIFQQADGAGTAAQAWTVVGFVLHPYFTIDPAVQDQIPASSAIFANYDDAQQIAGFAGLTAFHVRSTDQATATALLEPLSAILTTETPYTPIFNFLDDPDNNFILNIVSQVASILSILGILAIVVSGFLVTNVMNAIVMEQRRQIGTMKSLGASLWDNFLIYAGIALVYGIIGTVLGVALAIPAAAVMAQAIAPQAMTYIAGWEVSLQGVLFGVVMGLLVPVLASILPVVGGMRVSIREAITDLGISSEWGRSRMSRLIGGLPLPDAMVQGISHIYQKRGRLALTGLALTLAVAAFMGITAVDASLTGFIDALDDSFAYEIAVMPQDMANFDTVQAALLANVDGVMNVYPGYSAAVGVDGFVSTDPLAEGSNLVTATGIDPAQSAIIFDLREGRGWADDPQRAGVVISRPLAEALDKGAGDTLRLTIGAQTYEEPIIGVSTYAFDALYIDWRTLALRAGYVDMNGAPVAGMYYLDLTGHPSIAAVDTAIDDVSAVLLDVGVRGTYINQPKQSDAQAQQVSIFGVVFNATSFLMAAVGAVGLMAALSMAVFERLKEIGVRRSIGATSFAIMGQFMLEGVLVGLLAWIVAAPLSIGLGAGLMDILPFSYLSFTYPAYVLALGFAGIVLTSSLASLWPALAASRKTVADILRYQ